MSRPLRIVEPNTWHHVMNRSGSKRWVFLDDEDREGFLGLVQSLASHFGLLTTAYCLMGNHYHLLLLDRPGNLSKGMQHLSSQYTQRFNERHSQDGALFKGRFRSRLVQQEVYATEVVRYLHFNPVEAGIVEQAGDYPWSSHRSYLRRKESSWLRHDLVEPYLGELSEPVAFDQFVHKRAAKDVENELNRQRWNPVLGTKEFIEANKAEVRTRDRFQDTEIRAATTMVVLDPTEIIEAACRVFELERNEVQKGVRGTLNMPRLLTLLACKEFTATSNHVLGCLFFVAGPTMASLASNARKMMDVEPEAAEMWQRLVQELRGGNAQSQI